MTNFFNLPILAIDFSNTSQLLFFIVAIVLGATVLFLLIFSIISYFCNIRKNRIKDFNVRYYTYNSNTQTFTFFDKNSLNTKGIRTYSYEEFRNQIYAPNRPEVDNWLNKNMTNLENNVDINMIDDHIKVFIRLKNGKYISCEFILTPRKNNDEENGKEKNNILHFESHILTDTIRKIKKIHHKSSYQALSNTLSTSKAKKIYKKYILNYDEDCVKMITETDPNKIGAVYYIRLFYKGEKTELKNELLTDLVGTTNNASKKTKKSNNSIISKTHGNLLTAISSFINKNCKLFYVWDSNQNGEFAVMLIDNESLTKAIALRKADDLAYSIQALINTFDFSPYLKTNDIEEIKKQVPEFRVAIGFTIHSMFGTDFNLAKDQSCQMTDALMKINSNIENSPFYDLTESYKKVMFYDPEFFTNDKIREQNIQDISLLVKNSTFQIYFIPTLNLLTGNRSFYILNIVPYGTKLTSFPEILDIAADRSIENGQRRLLDSVINHCQKVLKSKGEYDGLMLNVSYSNAKNGYLQDAIKEFKASHIGWIFCFSENDLFIHSSGYQKEMKEYLLTLKKNGFKIALLIDNTSPLLWNIVKYFDFYVVGKKFTENLEDQTTYNNLSLIQQNYSKFISGQIVYSSLLKLTDIDIAAAHGAKIVSCNELALPSSRAEELNQKRVDEVLNVTNKLIKSDSDINITSPLAHLRPKKIK